MLNWKYLLPALVIGLGLLAGCGSPSQKSTAGMGEIPKWVASPQVEQGIAVTECVPASDNYSLDRKEAVANARASLAQQIQTKVQAMDKTYQRRIRADDKTTTGTTFESVSKQLTEQTLQGTVPKKMGYEMLNQQKHMCVMLTMGSGKMKEFFDRLMKQANAEVGPKDEEILYQEFKAKQAQEEMEQDLNSTEFNN
jgi:hypothetical protein